MGKRIITLSATITRNYGRVGATFGASQQVEVSTDLEAGRAYNELIGLVHFQFEEFEANMLRNEGRDVSVPAASMPGNTEWFTCDKFVMEIKQGKRWYSIVTKEPAFSKYGVLCYPEFLEKFPTLLTELGDRFSMDFPPGWKVLVDKSTKHKKAIHMDGKFKDA